MIDDDEIETACGYLDVALRNLAANAPDADDYAAVLERLDELRQMADTLNQA